MLRSAAVNTDRAPLVSIVLPLYNAESFLQPTLDSVLAQTYPNWELLVIDDGSQDGGLEVARRAADQRFRLFQRPNTGPCRSRNFGLARAQGDLVGFIDHDDIWYPEKLEKHVEHLARRPEVGVSYGPSEMIDAEGRPLGLLQMPKLTDIDLWQIICRCPVGNGSVPILRREALEQTRFHATYDGEEEPVYFDHEARGWEDVELWFRIAYKTDWLFEGIPDCLTKYRILPEGVAGNPERKQQNFERGLERVRAYAPEFIAEHEGAIRAYHLRYLARRLIHAGRGRAACSYGHRALAAHPRLLMEEPARTLSTLGAAYLLTVLPEPVFEPIKRFAVRRTRARQDAQARSS